MQQKSIKCLIISLTTWSKQSKFIQLSESFSKIQDDVGFMSFYAHENDILLDLDQLKMVCTERD